VTAFTEFNPAEPVGPGRTVIEASAGTGKTFTIAALVARLIAEEGIPLDEILVVTFTRAATAELRARVRDRLVETRRALLDPTAADRNDQHLTALLDPTKAEFDGVELEPRPRRAIARLGEALTHFDRAQIFTIHGFARRLLGQLGLRARLSPDIEPDTVDDLLLAEAAGDLIVGRYADHPDSEPIGRHELVDIGKVVVEKPDARIVPDATVLDGPARDRVELAHRMRAELQRRMRREGTATFDDGLAEVRDTLRDKEVGNAARALLQRRYSVALVDESQDTDPIQWQVIRSVFDESRLVVIGDPKQSIYSFRGADVESYLSALGGADALRTLTTNWRSDGPLIGGLDVLFGGAEFGDPRIAYHPIRPAPGHEPARIDGIGAPLSIRRFGDLDLPRYRNKPYFLVDPMREAVAADAAAEIVRLLTSAVTVDEDGTRVPLRPDHIAVLCRTNKQVEMIRHQLTIRSVPSVAARGGGVFTSPAAEEWRRFLLGVEQPDRLPLVRMASTSLLVGMSLVGVVGLAEKEVLELQQRFRAWQELLERDGVPALLGEVHRRTGVAERVLARPDGERVMTDLGHIAEEMHAMWRRRRIGSLAGWLEATMAEEARRAQKSIEEPESRQRRLETDAAAVQVQTVHVAKGLQWPVVLVPYAWDVPAIKPTFPVFHDPDAPGGATARPRLVNVAGQGSIGFDEHCALASAEEAAEEGRLLYVALTRAQHHLVVWWIENSAKIADSKLHELITRDGRTPEDLVAASAGIIEMPVLTGRPPVEQYRPATPTPTTLERARFERTLDYDWRRASFTSLSPEHPLSAATETTDRPLRTDEIGVDESEAAPPVSAATLPMADLPRGAQFGTLVHHVFETVPFDAPDLEGSIRKALIPELRFSAWDFDVDVLVAGMVAAMSTPLGPESDAPRLRDLDPGRLFDELTFEFPVRTHAGTVSLADIGSVMLDHLPDTDPYRPYAATLRDGSGQSFRGFLTGAIDLTAALPLPDGDRYVVIDYKSNAMPARDEAAGPHDYGPGPLAAAMIDGNYVLQATLYQVALHRYLQWRLRDYDPARHLGGAMYLFVRGMAGPDAPVIDGERCGVARWRPPVSMVVALSRLLAGTS
jgi:exodeoxyribonuclease V beta subunit